MRVAHAVAVSFLVLLAGCGGFLGGGSTATETPTPEVSVPDATPSPTPAAGTATPASTTAPDSMATRTVTNESLGVRFDLVGNRGALRSALTADITGLRITRGAVLECARTTPFVAVSTNQSVADVTATMSYDPAGLPPNASESDLSVFVYNRTVDFYLELETTVDAANDTATGTEVAPGQTFTRETDGGTEQVSPRLDGTRLDNAFVVMHAPTFWEAVETGDVPAQCQSGTPGSTSSPSE